MVYAITMVCGMAAPPDVLLGVGCLILHLAVYTFMCR